VSHTSKAAIGFIGVGLTALFAAALASARKAGLSVAQFHSVIGSGRMRSPFYDAFMRWSLLGDENARQFTIANAHRHMRYLASMAGVLDAINPIQASVKNCFAAMEAAGRGERYVPMLTDFIAVLNAVPPAAAER
jgi:3-hydroxyisobutyrate dehydrogenase-like beta-hydroxyacid dehydrogenase